MRIASLISAPTGNQLQRTSGASSAAETDSEPESVLLDHINVPTRETWRTGLSVRNQTLAQFGPGSLPERGQRLNTSSLVALSARTLVPEPVAVARFLRVNSCCSTQTGNASVGLSASLPVEDKQEPSSG